MHINFQINNNLQINQSIEKDLNINKTKGSLISSQTLYQPINVMSHLCEGSMKMLEEKVINDMEPSH